MAKRPIKKGDCLVLISNNTPLNVKIGYKTIALEDETTSVYGIKDPPSIKIPNVPNFGNRNREYHNIYAHRFEIIEKHKPLYKKVLTLKE